MSQHSDRLMTVFLPKNMSWFSSRLAVAAIALLGLSACVTPYPQGSVSTLTLSEARDAPPAVPEAVRWGGTIVSIENKADGTSSLEIVSRPLGYAGRPVRNDQSDGRFFAEIDDVVDPRPSWPSWPWRSSWFFADHQAMIRSARAVLAGACLILLGACVTPPVAPADGVELNPTAPNKIDPVDYSEGRTLTLVGVLDGDTDVSIGQSSQSVPTVRISDHHLWRPDDLRGRSRVTFGIGINISN